MPTLVERAEAFGGRAAYPEETTIVLVPVERAAEFMRAELVLGNTAEFIECLYLGAGTEPSMELSRERRDFESDVDFFLFAESAARTALDRAVTKSARAYFEIGVTER